MKITLCWLSLLLAGGLCLAQEPRGSILGRVVDPSGALVIGAKVHATNVATNTGASSVTNASGSYEIPYLLPGMYRVTAELDGFKKSVRDAIEVRVDDRLTLDFTLQMGDARETVTVTGDTPLLEVANANVGITMDQQRLADLPVSGGNPVYLVRLSAGVTSNTVPGAGADPSDLTGASYNLVVNGTRNAASELTMDGITNMSGTGSANFAPPRDLVQEFRVNTAAFDASMGHATGAIINVSLKTGTNKLHGTASFNDSRIRAMQWFSNKWLYDTSTGPINDEKRKQANPGFYKDRWGGTLLGPVVIPRLYDGRNRTFWSFGYDGVDCQRQQNFTGSVPTPAQRNGDFSALLALGARYQIYDPATATAAPNNRVHRDPLAGNVIPASRLDPIARKIMGYWPDPNAPGTAEGQQNYYRTVPIEWSTRSLVGRVDHSFSENNRFFIRANSGQWNNKTQNMPTVASGNVADRPTFGYAIDDVYVFNPELLLNLRYGATYRHMDFGSVSRGFDLLSLGFAPSLLAEINAKNNPAGMTFPTVNVDGLSGLGSGGGNRSTSFYQTFAGTLTKVMSGHSLRVGGEFRVMRDTGYAFGNVSPALNFSNNFTRGPLDSAAGAPVGQGLASMLLGIPTGGNVAINASRAAQSTFTALYAQDDWKVSRRLTLNLGLRYEYEGPITERYNRSIRGFDFTTPNPISAQAKANYARAPIPEVPVESFRTLGGVTFAGADGQPRGLWSPDSNNFAPRVGLAFRLTPKTVLRSGYGVFFDLMGIDQQGINQGGFNQSTPIVPTSDNGLTFRVGMANPFPDGFLLPVGASAGLRTQLGQGVTYFNSNPLSPYMQRWTLSIQRQLPARVVVEMSYVGNRGNKIGVGTQLNPTPRQYLSTLPVRDQQTINFLTASLPSPFYGVTEFNGTGLGTLNINRAALLRPYPQFNGISADFPVGASYYHSLQVSLEKRFSRGFSFQSSWTWSKFMDATELLNDTDPAPSKVISDLDRTHRFVASAIYELPVGAGKPLLGQAKGILNHVIGGWQAQGFYEGQAGQPLGFGNRIFNGDLNNIPLPRSQRSVERWFNTDSGFERDPNKQLGQNIRTFPARFSGIRGDGINNFDLSLFKSFPVREKMRLQFRMESYNSLNHPQFNNPNTNPAALTFGTVTGAHDQRYLTFALKLMF